jgi:hypothetical protein
MSTRSGQPQGESRLPWRSALKPLTWIAAVVATLGVIGYVAFEVIP